MFLYQIFDNDIALSDLYFAGSSFEKDKESVKIIGQ